MRVWRRDTGRGIVGGDGKLAKPSLLGLRTLGVVGTDHSYNGLGSPKLGPREFDRGGRLGLGLCIPKLELLELCTSKLGTGCARFDMDWVRMGMSKLGTGLCMSSKMITCRLLPT